MHIGQSKKNMHREGFIKNKQESKGHLAHHDTAVADEGG